MLTCRISFIGKILLSDVFLIILLTEIPLQRYTRTSRYAAVSLSFPQTPFTVQPVSFTVSSHWPGSWSGSDLSGCNQNFSRSYPTFPWNIPGKTTNPYDYFLDFFPEKCEIFIISHWYALIKKGADVMPPHCDTRDGPVVKACKKALETGNVNYALIWVPADSEPELKAAFEKTLKARKTGKNARDLADDWFFETAIRLHRAGEGASFTGMKPAGLDEGPVVPKAEKAIKTGDSDEVIHFIVHAVEEDLRNRFEHAMRTKKYDVNDVEAGRAFIQAYINFVVYSHHLYMSIMGGGDRGEHHH